MSKVIIPVSELIDCAKSVRKQAYAPYSKFSVGAAVRTASGAVFTGCNVENISFGLTLCAERAAMSAAVAAGERMPVEVAIVADTAEPVVPCGACRQFLAEFNPDLCLVLATTDGKQQEISLRELFPLPQRGILDRSDV